MPVYLLDVSPQPNRTIIPQRFSKFYLPSTKTTEHQDGIGRRDMVKTPETAQKQRRPIGAASARAPNDVEPYTEITATFGDVARRAKRRHITRTRARETHKGSSNKAPPTPSKTPSRSLC
jgi:hypothetical protein